MAYNFKYLSDVEQLSVPSENTTVIAVENNTIVQVPASELKPDMSNKQDKLSGASGQIVGFDENGNAIAQDIIQSDWNASDATDPAYVKNRTHYEETVLDFAWDGNTEGLDTVILGDRVPMYKISEAFDSEKIKKCFTEITYTDDGNENIYSTDNYLQYIEVDGGILFGVEGFAAINITSDDGIVGSNENVICTAPSKGFYVLKWDEMKFVKNIVIKSSKQLDEKFIPDTIQRKLTGAEGQVVGFDADGNPVAQDDVQSDWSINDATDPAYVKNRTHYKTVAMSDTLIITGLPQDVGYAPYSELPTLVYYKISDTVLTAENCPNGISFIATPDYGASDGSLTNAELIAKLDEDGNGVLADQNDIPMLLNICVPTETYPAPEPGLYAYGAFGVFAYQSITAVDSVIFEITRYTPLHKGYIPGQFVQPGEGAGSEVFNGLLPNAATGTASHAEGAGTSASGECSHAEGLRTTASGNYSHAEGYNTTASGGRSHAEGYLTTASELASHAEGGNTTAGGQYSHAEGGYTTTSEMFTHAEGYYTTASGQASHAEGGYTTASNYASHAQGKYNKAMTAGGSPNNSTGDAMVIGNGTGSSALSNAFRVTYAGETYGLSAFNSSGADYAEFFEWADLNPNDEDRVGYFVTTNGRHIRIANPGDYILGIVSGQPCIIGNSDEDWLGRWEHDEFGRFVREEVETPVTEWREVEVPVTDENGNQIGNLTYTVLQEVETGEVIKGWRYKANPNYDPSQQYIERKDRCEWDCVGMMGVLAVRDDGTCEVNGFCSVADGGIATKADSFVPGMTYRVIERVNENVVKIVFR